MNDARALVSLIMCLFFSATVLVALTWSWSASLLPMAVGCAGLLLSIFQFVEDLRVAKHRPLPIPRTAWILIGWICGFVLVSLLIGLVAGSFVSIAAYLRLQEKLRHVFSIAVAAVFTTFVWLLFDITLQLELYPGLIFD